MTDKPKAKLVDGVPVNTLEDALEIIERKDGLINDAKKASIDLRDKLLAERKEHDAEITKLNDQLAAERAKSSPAAVEKMARDRVAVMRKVADLGVLPETYDEEGKDIADIIKDAVVAVYGADKVAGKTPEYIRGQFDLLCEDDAGPTLGQALIPRGRFADRDNGRQGYLDRMTNAHKNTPAKAAAAQ